MKSRIGYAASVGESDVRSAIDFAADHGMNAVEINLNMPCFFPENYSRAQRHELNLYGKARDVALTLHAPEDIPLLQLHAEVRAAGLRRIKEMIDFGADIGATRMTIHVGVPVYFTMTEGKCYLDELYYREFRQVLKSALNELIAYCGERLKLCVENSGRFPKILVQEGLEELLADGKALYFTWDIGHSYTNLYGEVEFFLKHLDRVKTCHLHDVNAKSDHQVIGEGRVDFPAHFARIKGRDILNIIEVRPREKALVSFENLQKRFAETGSSDQSQ